MCKAKKTDRFVLRRAGSLRNAVQSDLGAASTKKAFAGVTGGLMTRRIKENRRRLFALRG